MEAVRKRHHNSAAAAAAVGLIPSILLCDHIPEQRIANKQTSVPNLLLMIDIGNIHKACSFLPLDLYPLAQDFQNQKQYSCFLHLHRRLPLQFSRPFFSLSDRGQRLSAQVNEMILLCGSR